MVVPPDWPNLYRWLSPHVAACVDIEVTRWGGPISVVGIYHPSEGEVKVTSLVRGRNLSRETLAQALKGKTLLVTFNGKTHDLPKLEKEFPGIIPDDAVSFDLFEIATSLNLKAGLKFLESQFGIDRPDWMTRKRHIAVALWKRFEEHGDEDALRALLDYNARDAWHLHLLALRLIEHHEKERQAAVLRLQQSSFPSFIRSGPISRPS